jgi:hypothetical protein
MITLQNVRNYVEFELDVDLTSKSRIRKFVYGRVIYAKLCREFVKNAYGKPISYQTIADSIKKKDHATMIYYCKNLFYVVKENEKEIYLVYKRFKEVKDYDTYSDVKLKYNALMDDYQILNAKYERTLENTTPILSSEFNEVICSVPDDKLELLLTRIKPIAKMLNSHKIL